MITLCLLWFRPEGAGAEGDPLELVLDALLLQGEAAETQDVARRAELLGEAEVALSRVIEDFPTSEVARLLSSEQGVTMLTPRGGSSITLQGVRSERRMAIAGAEAVRSLNLCSSGLTRSCLFDEALAIARHLEDGYGQQSALEGIAQAQAEAGHFQGALSTAARIGDPSGRGFALGRIATAQAKAASAVEAQVTVDAIELKEWRAAAQRSVAVALAESGRFHEALDAARQIDSAIERAEALLGVAVAQADPALMREASEAAHEIEDLARLSFTLRDIGVAQARAGQVEDALSIARGIEDPFLTNRAHVLIAVAEFQSDPTLFTEALMTAAGTGNSWERDTVARDVAKTQALVGLESEALATIRSIDDQRLRVWALSDVASALAQAGRFVDALRLAAGVHLDASNWRAALPHDWALRDIAAAQAQAGQNDDALVTALRIWDPYLRADALGVLSAELGRPAFIGEALAAARQVEEIERRTEIMHGLAVVQAEVGTVGEALATVGEIEDMSRRARAMAEVAKHVSR